MSIDDLLDLANNFKQEYNALVDKYRDKVDLEDLEKLDMLLSEKSNPYTTD